MKNKSIARLRILAFIEGLSYLLLLFVAMPLKYVAGIPMAVRVVGMLHGLLFVGFGFSLLHAMLDAKWSLKWTATVFLSAVVPFGTFWMDPKLKALLSEAEQGSASGVD
jgi:integral membrane protein